MAAVRHVATDLTCRQRGKRTVVRTELPPDDVVEVRMRREISDAH
jgi:hypothetical protein